MVTINKLVSDDGVCLPTRERTLDKRIIGAGLGTMNTEVKNEEGVVELVDVLKPAASSELGPQLGG